MMEEPISAPVEDRYKTKLSVKIRLSLLLRWGEIHSGNNHYLEKIRTISVVRKKMPK